MGEKERKNLYFWYVIATEGQLAHPALSFPLVTSN